MHDPDKLQFDADPNSSVLVYDEVTRELIMVILRNFTGHPGLLACLLQVIVANLEHRKNMRVCVIFQSIYLT
jgi:hypothetical protein